MNNIILIGMPGVGKSTVGVILAKEAGLSFTDTDLVIQNNTGKLLKDIIAEAGVDGFLKVEEESILALDVNDSVIATGGSVVYSAPAMEKLKKSGIVVYLKLPLDELKTRLDSLTNRGVVLRTGQNLEDLFIERTVLYEKYADITVLETAQTAEETMNEILDRIKRLDNMR